MQEFSLTHIFNSFPTLHSERLDLIEIKQEHLSDIFKIFGDPNVTRFYNIITLRNEREGQQIIDWFQTRFHDRQGIRWGIALKGTSEIIGTVGFNSFSLHHKANIGYDLQAEYWNKGYVSEALRAIVDFGFSKLSVHRIEAEVMLGNIASERVLTKLGFTNEGTLRQWMYWNEKYYDMVMFSLLKSDVG